ncbi:MAG TPA: hypothetical protein VI072_09445 [Polyangiaceae bacterium]
MAAFIVAVGAAYGIGRFQLATQLRDAEGRTQEVEQKLRTEQQRITALEARRHLHLSLLALDERNFGIGQKELEEAARLLGQPTNQPEHSKLAAEIQRHRIIASEDLGAQRQKLLAWTRALDALL